MTTEPPCLLCHVTRDDGSEIPHAHYEGRTPQTPCPPCWDGAHGDCTPEPWWCGCSHPVCLLLTTLPSQEYP